MDTRVGRRPTVSPGSEAAPHAIFVAMRMRSSLDRGSSARLAAALAVSIVATATRTRAQDTLAVVVPPPPSTASVAAPHSRCREGAERRPDGRCFRHFDGWEPGPSLEMVVGSLGLFAVGYLVQALSTAVSVAQGEHDVGPTYSADSLTEYERWGYLPLVGPWAKLALAPPHVDQAGGALFAVEGLLELGGVVVFVISLFVHPVDEWRRETVGRWRVSPRASGLALETFFD